MNSVCGFVYLQFCKDMINDANTISLVIEIQMLFILVWIIPAVLEKNAPHISITAALSKHYWNCRDYFESFT